MNRLSALCLSTLFAAACGAPPEAAPVAETHADLLGSVSFGSDCTSTDKEFIWKATHYGRTVATTDAFAQCLDRAIRTGFSGSGGQVGPYLQCNGDPFYGSTIDYQVTEALKYAHSNDDVSMQCTGGSGNASAAQAPASSWGHTTSEDFAFSGWLRGVDGSLSLPVCADDAARAAGGCRWAGEPWPWDQAAGLVWHEGSHTHGYTHGGNDQASGKAACGYSSLTDAQWNFQTNTMPYIIGNCISEVIDRSANRCGAPLECGNGLKIVDGFDASTCTCTQDPQQAGVSWTRVGTPGSASKIATCGDGRLYALNTDRTLYVNSSGGADSGWTYLGNPWGAQDITCANNTLYAFNDDRSLWRNDGSDSAISWTRVGQPSSAKQVAGATSFGFFWNYGLLYALNDDNTLWKSFSGEDGSWTYVGQPGSADRIAVGGAFFEARLFALNGDKGFYLNSGDGCDQYWHPLDQLSATSQIAAQNSTTLFALNTDHSLWRGTVTHSDWLTALSFGKPRHCDGTRLVE